MRGIVHNIDESRGAELACSAGLTPPRSRYLFSHSLLLQSTGLGSTWCQFFFFFVLSICYFVGVLLFLRLTFTKLINDKPTHSPTQTKP